MDLTRDPDYYEEKMREREFSVDEVDWVPPETVPVMAEFAPGFEADAELVQVVHASPAAVTIADPFAGVEENSEPEMRVAEVAAAAPEFALAAPEFVDPFAGIDFSTGPVAAVAESIGTVAEPEAMVAPAAPEFVDPFAGIDFAGPVAAVAEPIGTEAEAVVAMPEPESEEAVPEAEAVVAVPEPEVVEAAPGAEAVVAMPEPEVEAYEESEAEVVSEATVDEPEIAALEIAEPEVVGEEEVLYVPEVAAQAEESMEAEAESPSAESDSGPEAAETAAASEAETEAAEIRTPWTVAAARRNPNDITFSAQEYYQQQVGKKYSTKAVAEAGQTSPFGKEAEANPEDFSAALKTLMQLGSVLPLAARMSTASEGEEGVDMAGGGNQEVKQEVSGLRLLQYEIKTTVQDHSTHLKRLEDQLTQILESAEMGSADSASVMDNVKSTAKMVRVMGIGLGLMLMVLILMIGMILVHAK
ncbi:MAG TPA: hypothetical protein VMU92_01860 [Acidobacteriaceae bacterium]|nr:hypothetical protein [Acidobacteriaceae bacterium]